LLARLTVARGGGLDGRSMREMSARTRVIALDRAAGGLEHPPRRDTIFAAGDSAYIVGPYEELLQVLLRDLDVGSATPR
jgi:Trk K+ transport system NAD-binding subunit